MATKSVHESANLSQDRASESKAPSGLDDTALAQAAVPSHEGNQIIYSAESNRNVSHDALPAMNFGDADPTSHTLLHAVETEVVAGGIGAIGGASAYGTLGYGVGSIAQLFMKAPTRATMPIATAMGFDMAKAGALHGGLAGLAAGAAIFGAYELTSYLRKDSH